MHWTTYCIDGSQALLSSLVRKSQSAVEGRAGVHLVCVLAAWWLAAGMSAYVGPGGGSGALHEQEQGLACFKL